MILEDLVDILNALRGEVGEVYSPLVSKVYFRLFDAELDLAHGWFLGFMDGEVDQWQRDGCG